MNLETTASQPAAFELRFQSLLQFGKALVFPCDRNGNVDLDHFTERARNNYLFARATMGREYAWPQVLPAG